MCAIFGVVIKESQSAIPQYWVRDATATMTHRGPDDDGLHICGNVALGHRRLSIIDLAGGRQPIFSQDGRLAIVFNGEIYNYADLRQELQAANHHFSTRSDTEVILKAYEEWGVKCLARLRGMFSFAIYDQRQNAVFLARDRVGIKPLYYFEDEKALVFASEIKALLKSDLVRASVNYPMLDFFVTLGYVPGPETLFTGIRKLPPGHYLWFGNGSTSIQRYWSIEGIEKSQAPFEVQCSKLRELLLKTVDEHLMSEVPLGVFLSGGVDSSAVVACMARVRNEPIDTFSVGYDESGGLSELSYAARVAKMFGTRHHPLVLSPETFLDGVGAYLEHMEEPVLEGAGIALLALSRIAKRHVTVALCGEGADELFAGYPIYSRMLTIERLRWLRRVLPLRTLSRLGGRSWLSERAVKYLDWLQLPFDRRYQGVSSDLAPSLKARMYRADALTHGYHQVERFFGGYLTTLDGGTVLEKMLRTDLAHWLPDDLLLKADKMTMAASIELRVPFLDHVMVEFAASVPDSYKLNGRQGKYILKKAVEPFLPQDVVSRRKAGFPVPIAKWLRKDLYEPVAAVLLAPESFILGFFEKAYVERCLDRHRRGKEDVSKRLFSMYIIERWYRQFVCHGARGAE